MSGVSASALCQLTSCDSEPIESSCRNWMAGYFSPLSLNLNTRRKQHERVEPPVQCEPQPQLPPFLDFCVLGSVRSRSCQCRKWFSSPPLGSELPGRSQVWLAGSWYLVINKWFFTCAKTWLVAFHSSIWTWQHGVKTGLGLRVAQQWLGGKYYQLVEKKKFVFSHLRYSKQEATW